MKIIKAVHIAETNHYYIIFDEIPRLTYEKIGSDYVGSAVDDKRNIVFSECLKWDRVPGAFSGREFTLEMKDGTTEKIKDHWYDTGHYPAHGDFIEIGASTLEQLQECYVYYGYQINRKLFEEMVDEYLLENEFCSYEEGKIWVNLQYNWYPVKFKGKPLNLLMNIRGDFINADTKEREYGITTNRIKHFKGTDKCFGYIFFKYAFVEDGRLVNYECNLRDLYMENLPFSEEEKLRLFEEKYKRVFGR